MRLLNQTLQQITGSSMPQMSSRAILTKLCLCDVEKCAVHDRWSGHKDPLLRVDGNR